MAVTSHLYPYAQQLINEKAINLTGDSLHMGLLVNPAATWGATQEAYQFVSAVTGAYTEVTSSGYNRVALTTCTVTYSGAKTTWTCTAPAPISFGSSITLSAAAAFVYDSSIGSADSSYPVLTIIDFGGSVNSASGAWTYTVDPVNGLCSWTSA
jgi:hypothetical protein